MSKRRKNVKTIFVINPKAGTGDEIETLKAKVQELSSKYECEAVVTENSGKATEFVKNTLSENPDKEYRFVACGGDGTINSVFTGAIGFKNASVSVYPCGSGNDFVKVFGAENFSDPEAIINAPVRRLDALKVGSYYSFNVTNFGFDTTVAITINKEREKTGHGDKNAYTKGVMTALAKAMRNKGKVWADGELLNESGKFLLCTCANGQYVGGSFKCAPRASVDDGLIEVCVIKPITRIKFVTILDTYTKGEHLEAKNTAKIVTYRQAKKIHVEGPDGFAYSLDGEIIYSNNFDIEIVPDALSLAVPVQK